MLRIYFALVLFLITTASAATAQPAQTLWAGDFTMNGNIYDVLPERFLREVGEDFDVTFNCMAEMRTYANGNNGPELSGCSAAFSPSHLTVDQTLVARRSRMFRLTRKVKPITGPVTFTFICKFSGEHICGIRNRPRDK